MMDDCVFLCSPFFPRGVLDEISDLTESVSEGCLTYSWILCQSLLTRDKAGNHVVFMIVFT